MKRILTYLAALLCVVTAWGGPWHTDSVLGAPFQARTVVQPSDYSGPVRSTIVRLKSHCANGTGVLYVHGYNDYFFQKDEAQRFADHCYDFYAVDLRKYGRSLLPGQRRFEVRNISEYYADIDSAITQMQRDGIDRIVLMGHSTGGLICAAYMSRVHPEAVKALILNSPFLDWNQSKFQEKMLIPTVRAVGGLLPKIKISQGEDTTYARSLLKKYDGEWDYNTDWKLVKSPAVTTGWIRAIDAAHSIVQHNPDIKVPILLMHSAQSGTDPAGSDMVLDVQDISKYGRRLGPDVTEITVPGGLHDLVLSKPAVRNRVYGEMLGWLEGTLQ